MSQRPKRYTAQEFAERECYWQGHDFSEYVRYGSQDPTLVVCTRCGASWGIKQKIEAPKIEVEVRQLQDLIQSTHRSTLFQLSFPINGLMDENLRSLVSGDELEYILIEYCTRAIKSVLAEAREKIPRHP